MSSISDPTCVAPSFPKLERSIPKDPIQTTWSVSRADIWQAMHGSLTSQLRHAHNGLDSYMNAVQSICTLPNNIPTNIKLTAPFTEFEAKQAKAQLTMESRQSDIKNTNKLNSNYYIINDNDAAS